MQISYQIVVKKCSFLDETVKETVWDSERMLSEESIHVVYAGSSLEAETKYEVQVIVEDNHGRYEQVRLLLVKSIWGNQWIQHLQSTRKGR